jgi:hypothetical protein
LEDLYTHYDGTVRNAAGGIVQLRYGEDGMDPVAMEGKRGEPVAFARLLALVKASQPRAAVAAARGAAPPPGGPQQAAAEAEAGVTSPKGRRSKARGKAAAAGQQPLSPRSPMSPASPSAAAAAAAALDAADNEARGRELVPLPDQLQAAVEAAMQSGALAAVGGLTGLGGCFQCRLPVLPPPTNASAAAVCKQQHAGAWVHSCLGARL